MSPHFTALLLVLRIGQPQLSVPSEPFLETPTVSAVSEQQLLDFVLPLPLTASRPFPGEVRWIVTFRVRPALEPEFWCQLTTTYSGEMRFDAREIKTAPLGSQFRQLAAAKPDLTLDVVSASLAIDRWHSSSKTCNSLFGLASSISRLEVSVIPSDELLVHGTLYEAVFESRMGRVTYAVTVGRQASSHDVLAKWLDRARTSVESCRPRVSR